MKNYSIILGDAEFTFFLKANENYENITVSPPHLHALPELFVIIDGKGVISGDFGSAELQSNKICLIPPRVYHHIINDEKYTRLAIQFLIRRISEKGSIYDKFAGILSSDRVYVDSVDSWLVSEIYKCLRVGGELNEEKLKGLLLVTFIDIAKRLFSENTNKKSDDIFDKKNEYYALFAENDGNFDSYLAGEITAHELADCFFITARQLSRTVLKEYGVNLKDLRQEVRMRRARYYLCNTDYTASRIAALLGFSSKESFYTVYKRYYGEGTKATKQSRLKR